MSSYALRCFADAFGSNRSFIQFPLFLTPRATISCCQNARFQSSQQHPSFTPAIRSTPCPHLNQSYLRPQILTKTKLLADSPYHSDPSAWARLLDPFLPLELRSEKLAISDDTDEGFTIKSIDELPLLLREARLNTTLEIDLLSYLGVNQGRWKAVLWLIKAVSHPHQSCADDNKHLDRQYAPHWANFETSLEKLSESAIWADDLIQPLSNTALRLEKLTEPDELLVPGTKSNIYHEGIGQIWQSAGHMILQAADRPLDDSGYKLILSHVFQILAHMHHIDAFPDSIYNQNLMKDPFVANRPPSLDVLSAQIMAILSDSTWRAHDSEMLSKTMESGADDVYKKHDPSRANSRVGELGVVVWLDRLLRVCLEGGWHAEAAWIVNEIDKRNQDPNSKWSVIKWDSTPEPALPGSTWSTKIADVISISRVGEIAGGTGIVKPSEDILFVNLAPRSISRELVKVLIDGFVVALTGTKTYGIKLKSIQHAISACKRLLSKESYGMDPNTSNSIMLRLIDSEVSDAMRSPELLEQIMQLASTGESGALPTVPFNSLEDSRLEFMTPNSALNLGLLHQMLFCFARTDNIRGALQTFSRMQELRDLESQQLIRQFASKIQRSNLHASGLSLTNISESNANASLHKIPYHALAAFLDFVIHAELWEMARWIIYSDDADGPTISSDLYSVPSLQPILIRFATATSDNQLLAKVTEKLKAPLSHSNLQALLHYQIAIGNWDSVEELLSYFKDEPKMPWDASDAIKIATAVLYMENDTSKANASRPASLSRAIAILQKLLSGEYNSIHGTSRDRDKSQILLMNQLGRIFMDIPGKLSTLILPPSILDRRLNTRVSIPGHAFNILLKGVVDCHGSMAGQKLWDRWCQGNKTKMKNRWGFDQYETEHERVVVPNLRTLRIIIQPSLRIHLLAQKSGSQARIGDIESRKNGQLGVTMPQHLFPINDGENKQFIMSENASIPETDRRLLKWGVRMYRNLGLSKKEIEFEIPKDLSV